MSESVSLSLHAARMPIAASRTKTSNKTGAIRFFMTAHYFIHIYDSTRGGEVKRARGEGGINV